jgi:hypothetical protein
MPVSLLIIRKENVTWCKHDHSRHSVNDFETFQIQNPFPIPGEIFVERKKVRIDDFNSVVGIPSVSELDNYPSTVGSDLDF